MTKALILDKEQLQKSMTKVTAASGPVDQAAAIANLLSEMLSSTVLTLEDTVDGYTIDVNNLVVQLDAQSRTIAQQQKRIAELEAGDTSRPEWVLPTVVGLAAFGIGRASKASSESI